MWDAHGRLCVIDTVGDGTAGCGTTGADIVVFDYDSHGRRIRRESVGRDDIYTYDPAAGLSRGIRRLALNDQPENPGPNDPADYFSYDVTESTTAAPTSAATAPTNGYEPFGRPVDFWSALYFGCRGELHLDQLIYLRARDYDPATGTFLTRDPLDGVDGTPTVANGYHYADNDPVNKTDPLGLRPEDGEFGFMPFPTSTAGGVPITCGANEHPETTPPAGSQILGGTYDGNYQCFSDPVECSAGFLQSLLGDRIGLALHVGCLLRRSTSPAAEALAASWAYAELRWGTGDLDIGCARSPHLNLAVACIHHARTFVPAFRINKDAEATTHGHFVFCKDRCSGTLLEHEVVHVGQWEDEGDRFAINYAIEAQRNGTGCRNKYEIPAYDQNWPCPH